MLKEFTREDTDFKPSKYEIVPMLLSGVADKIHQAREAERVGCYAEKGFYLGRATGILDALRNMLDISDTVGQDLDTIYSHIDLLLQASAEDKPSNYLDEALEIVESMASISEPMSMDMPLGAGDYLNEARA